MVILNYNGPNDYSVTIMNTLLVLLLYYNNEYCAGIQHKIFVVSAVCAHVRTCVCVSILYIVSDRLFYTVNLTFKIYAGKMKVSSKLALLLILVPENRWQLIPVSVSFVCLICVAVCIINLLLRNFRN